MVSDISLRIKASLTRIKFFGRPGIILILKENTINIITSSRDCPLLQKLSTYETTVAPLASTTRKTFKLTHGD